jgi:precorrin-6A/cobalt-precorrin-6A reductase
LMRVLLLGGTSEARALAARLHPGVDVISSLAGRVPDPALPVGEVRIGGFGGVDGMRRWLTEAAVDAVVDATHPYAATITAHAATVCDELQLPHLVLARPAWDPGDAIVVDSDAEAAKTVAAERHSRVFLTTGRSGTAAFADVDAWFLIRAVTAPVADTLPRRHQLVLSRGPYHYDDEVALMRDHHIDALVTKNSGGAMTRPKLDAAAALGVAVVMVDRPPPPPDVATVTTVDDAVEWVSATAR